MKSLQVLIALIAVSASLVGCDKEDNGKTRMEAFPDRLSSEGRKDHDGQEPAEQPPVLYDTALFVAAVAFPEGYDWRRDTSYGSVTGRLVLYRDGELILSVPAGHGCTVSLDHDMHHLAAGHLFTESCTADKTVIGRDGKDIFSYPGREFLCGLLVEGDNIFTLGQNRSGSGFSLRRNGEEMFARTEGTIPCHISDNPRYPGGALYRDGGHLYFSYFKPGPDAGGRRIWYIVEDGTETMVETKAGRTFDIRMKDGKLSVIAVLASGQKDWIYRDGSWSAQLRTLTDGSITVTAPFSKGKIGLSPSYLPSFRVACLTGEHLYLGVNPLDGGRPWLWKDGQKEYELEINGFVTAVGYTATPRDK